MPYQPRERARRNRFTLNNPFITDDVKVLDPNNLTDEQKALLGKEVKHDFSFTRQPQYEQYFTFAICEYDKKENKKVIAIFRGSFISNASLLYLYEMLDNIRPYSMSIFSCCNSIIND